MSTDDDSLLEQLRESLRNDAHAMHFKSLITSVIALRRPRSVLEIGAGRRPLFSADEIADLSILYTANDISQGELDRLAPNIPHTCFDIAQPSQPDGSYDLLFSCMVLEHVTNGRHAHKNSAGLLREGGIAIHTFPTLYDLPFVINHLLPNGLSERSHRLVNRRDLETQPKFPAHYDLCTSSKRNEDKIQAAGFRRVELIPLWGHHYYARFPRLDAINTRIQGAAKRRDLRWTSSYAIAVCFK